MEVELGSTLQIYVIGQQQNSVWAFLQLIPVDCQKGFKLDKTQLEQHILLLTLTSLRNIGNLANMVQMEGDIYPPAHGKGWSNCSRKDRLATSLVVYIMGLPT